MHIQTCALIHICMYIHTQCMHAHAAHNACMYMQTHIHTCIHMQSHVYTYKCICTWGGYLKPIERLEFSLKNFLSEKATVQKTNNGREEVQSRELSIELADKEN